MGKVKMRIAIALWRTGREICGDYKSIDTLASELSGEGIDVTVLASKLNRSRIYRSIAYSPIKYKHFMWPASVGHFLKGVHTVSKNVDLIQCNLTNPAFGIVSDLVAIKNETPTITNFGIPFIEDSKSITPYFGEAPLRCFRRMLFYSKTAAKLPRFLSHRYVVSSEYQKTQLESLGLEGERIEVIPNSVDLQKYRPYDRRKAKEGFKFGEEFIVSYIGHFTHNKGVRFLIKSFKEVLEIFPETKLVLAWSGLGSKKKVLRAIYKKGSKDRVINLGIVNVPKLLSATDVLVLPYMFIFGTQVFPRILLEAFSVGVPIVSSNLRALQEIIKDGETGLLVPPGNPGKIAEAIVKLLSNEILRRNMIKRQRTTAKERFDSKKVAQQYIKLYHDVLEIDSNRKACLFANTAFTS